MWYVRLYSRGEVTRRCVVSHHLMRCVTSSHALCHIISCVVSHHLITCPTILLIMSKRAYTAHTYLSLSRSLSLSLCVCVCVCDTHTHTHTHTTAIAGDAAAQRVFEQVCAIRGNLFPSSSTPAGQYLGPRPVARHKEREEGKT